MCIFWRSQAFKYTYNQRSKSYFPTNLYSSPPNEINAMCGNGKKTYDNMKTAQHKQDSGHVLDICNINDVYCASCEDIVGHRDVYQKNGRTYQRIVIKDNAHLPHSSEGQEDEDGEEEEEQVEDEKLTDGGTKDNQKSLVDFGCLDESEIITDALEDMDDNEDEIHVRVSSETESGTLKVIASALPSDKAHLVTIEQHEDGHGHRVDRCSCPDYYHRQQRHGYMCKHMQYVDDLL